MACTSASTAVSSETSSLESPSQAGVQPPASRTKERLNSVSPESAMIWETGGGSLSSGMKYTGCVHEPGADDEVGVGDGEGDGVGVGVGDEPAGPVSARLSA